MSKRESNSDRENDYEWAEDEKFADFFKEYIYRPDADENLKTFITYRSLYLIYVNSQKAQAKIRVLDDKFSTMQELLAHVDMRLCEAQNIIAAQEGIYKIAKRNTKFLLISVIGLFMILGYTVCNLFFLWGSLSD